MKTLLGVALALALAAGSSARGQESYATRPDVRAFINEMVQRHGFVEAELNTVFARAQRKEAILVAIDRPPEKTKPWTEYRAGFLTEQRVREGIQFWNKHRAPLARATREYGVPAEVIVAILGVETYYGRRKGRWRVIDSLVTLAFDFPPRAAYFRSELEHYLLLVREAGIDVFEVHGSYAGAIGMPQFMPRSYMAYAVDFDGSGTVNLSSSAADAIGSVANFLRKHGWRAGQPVQSRATVRGNEFTRSLQSGVEPRYTLTELASAGVELEDTDERLAADTLAALVELTNGPEASEFRVGFHNFYVLTRYNRSALYSSVVVDLAAVLHAGQLAQNDK